MVAGLALVIAVVGLALRPPRLAWASGYRNPACPPGFRAMVVFGKTGLDDVRIRLSGNRLVFVFVPPRGQPSDRWPRMTGGSRPDDDDRQGSEEIELHPP